MPEEGPPDDEDEEDLALEAHEDPAREPRANGSVEDSFFWGAFVSVFSAAKAYVRYLSFFGKIVV